MCSGDIFPCLDLLLKWTTERTRSFLLLVLSLSRQESQVCLGAAYSVRQVFLDSLPTWSEHISPPHTYHKSLYQIYYTGHVLLDRHGRFHQIHSENKANVISVLTIGELHTQRILPVKCIPALTVTLDVLGNKVNIPYYLIPKCWEDEEILVDLSSCQSESTLLCANGAHLLPTPPTSIDITTQPHPSFALVSDTKDLPLTTAVTLGRKTIAGCE